MHYVNTSIFANENKIFLFHLKSLLKVSQVVFRFPYLFRLPEAVFVLHVEEYDTIYLCVGKNTNHYQSILSKILNRICKPNTAISIQYAGALLHFRLEKSMFKGSIDEFLTVFSKN